MHCRLLWTQGTSTCLSGGVQVPQLHPEQSIIKKKWRLVTCIQTVIWLLRILFMTPSILIIWVAHCSDHSTTLLAASYALALQSSQVVQVYYMHFIASCSDHYTPYPLNKISNFLEISRLQQAAVGLPGHSLAGILEQQHKSHIPWPQFTARIWIQEPDFDFFRWLHA